MEEQIIIEQKFYSLIYDKNNTILELLKQTKELQKQLEEFSAQVKEIDNGKVSYETNN